MTAPRKPRAPKGWRIVTRGKVGPGDRVLPHRRLRKWIPVTGSIPAKEADIYRRCGATYARRSRPARGRGKR